ncbi:outer membrane beta-barrel protein [Emticicia sp. ODNR4P]|nr:outer membrane beta-barrel protein [Emticicia sp. ODNR4P]
MKNLINLMLSLFITYSSLGQIKGKIVDDKQQAASFANILVLNTKDSSLVKGEAADVDGKFEISGLKPQAYLLQVSAVGFQKSYQVINLESAKALDLGIIQLKAETQTLGEVQVTARKQLIERDGDKMIMNVEASPTATGLNGLELMEKVPGVTVDRNTETIKLKGKDGVLIMIDDRKTYLTDEQLANFLKTLKSEDIEKIEIIANPSARFDASGSSGIINIKTKKGKNFGTNYILDLNAGYSHYKGIGGLPKNGQGLTINSRREKYVIFGNINRQYTAWYNSEDQVQNFLSATGSVLEKRVITGLAKGNFENLSAKIGFDYDLSKKTTVGFSGQWANTSSPMNRSYNQQSVSEAIRQSLQMDRSREATFDNYTFNTHLKQKIDTSGTELTVDFDVILNSKSWDDRFVTTTTQNDANPSVANNQILFPTNNKTFVLKADFIKKLTAKTKIETGIKTSYSKKTNDFSDNFRDNGALVSSFFKFNELISAGYVMINSELTKSLSLQAGLRAEQTNNQGLNREGNKLTQQDYLNLFPTLTLNQKVSKDYAISLGYSRRINRPNDDVFNTFKRFFSPQSYVAGNPTILPSLNNTVSLTNTIKDKYSFSLNYVSVNQFSTEVFDVDTVLIPGRRVIRESMENVNGKIGWWSVDASVPFNPTKWWSVNLNYWGGINVYNYKRESTVVDISQLYHGAYMQHTFTLNKTLSGEISGWYSSGETWGFQTSKPQGGLDFGLKKMLWDKKATVKFLVQDPFNFNSYRNNVETATLTGVGTYRWDNRRFRISLTYNFGNTNVKQAIQSNDGGNGGGGGPSKN